MDNNEREFCIEITKERAISISNEISKGQVYFIKILDFDYVATSIEKKHDDFTFSEARYFLNFKRYITYNGIK